MLTPIKKSIFQIAPPPEAFISGLAVVNPWSFAALATPVVLGATVAAFRAHSQHRKANRSELEMILTDFCEGR